MFDPALDRLVPSHELLDRSLRRLRRIAAATNQRVADIAALRDSLQQSSSVLELRERDVVRQIENDAEILVHAVRRREKELISQVRADCEEQRKSLASTRQQVEDASSGLLPKKAFFVQALDDSSCSAHGDCKDQDKSKNNEDDASEKYTVKQGLTDDSTAAKILTELSECEQLLGNSQFFEVMEPYSYRVNSSRTQSNGTETDNSPTTTSSNSMLSPSLESSSSVANGGQSAAMKPFRADAHLSITRHKVGGLDVPVALTVRMTTPSVVINPPSCALSSAASAGGGVQGGIFNFIATSGNTRVFRNPVESGAIVVKCTVDATCGAISNLFDVRTASPDFSAPQPTVGVKGEADDDLRALANPATFQEKNCFRTRSVRGARIVVDFGDGKQVVVAGYALRHGHKEEHAAMRNWRLLGSNDPSVFSSSSPAGAGADWTELDRRIANPELGHGIGCSCDTAADERAASPPKNKSGSPKKTKNTTVLKSSKAPFNVVTFLVGDQQKSDAATVEEPSTKEGEALSSSSPPLVGGYRYLALENTGPNAAGDTLYHIELSHWEVYGTLRTTTTTTTPQQQPPRK